MRLIDADQFGVVSFQGKSKDFIDGALFILDKIYDAPTVERHGEWKPSGNPDDLGIRLWRTCSNCGFRTTWHMVDVLHFCPNCGSDNRKEGDPE